MNVGVAYGTDLNRVRDVLLDIAAGNEFAVQDPAPIVVFNSFANSSIDIMFGVWALTSDFINLKNSVMVSISRRFAEENITIPFTQLDVHLKND